MSNRTQFAGVRNAVDFAYGINPQVPPLSLLIGGGPGSGVGFTLQIGIVTLSDGSTINPLATTAPIVMGIGTNAETVTPSAVSSTTPSVPGTSTFTATVANNHGIGDFVTSGSVGLQEAINAAIAGNGGIVAIDNAWTALGGTSAMLATAQATLTAGTVSIEDNRTGSGQVRTAVVTLSNAQVLAMFTTPVQIVAAQGLGTVVNVISMLLENVDGGVAYGGGGAIQLSYGSGLTTPASVTVAATFLTSPTVTQVITAAGALATAAASAVVNKAVNITNATAVFTTGTGTVKVVVNYTVVTGF